MSQKKPNLPRNAEEIDGPGIAAKILSHMPNSNRERLMVAIRESNAEVAAKIQDKLFRFDDLADLPREGMQRLLSEIDHKDLVLSMKTASQPVKQAVTANLSERRRKMLDDDFLNMPKVPLSDVEAAQRRILVKLDELRTAGAIRTGGRDGIYV